MSVGTEGLSAQGSAERRRTNKLRGNEKRRVRRLGNCQRQNRADQSWNRACRDGLGDSRVRQCAGRTRVIGYAPAVRMDVNSSDEASQSDQEDATHRYRGVCPA